ncbi:MAG: GSCFA domain-containing protein [Bacteroidaceae bacterium]|nr:GSCFA domain-containing protein [Bacteroidaceae bacterium]
MNLITPVQISKPSFDINHAQRILMLGSCFVDEMGVKLQADKFHCLVNPFGVLYNPASIAALLLRSISEREYDDQSPEILFANGLFHSWMHHSQFSSANKKELTDRLNSTLLLVSEWLQQADILIITFGTSYIYRLKDTGMLVSNCHKQPDSLFLRQRLSAYDIADSWKTLLQLLHSVNPKLRVIFTVSPIRHKRDGLHENQLSKAELLLAIDEILQTSPVQDCSYYFPSYEILLDELRDYRFYATDMVHPSPLAVDYIYEQFQNTLMSKEEQKLSALCREVQAALEHKPFHSEAEAYQQFIQQTIQKINYIKQRCPDINLDTELTQCNTRLNK